MFRFQPVGLAIALVLASTAPTMAEVTAGQPPADSSAQSKKPKQTDLDQVVCRYEEVTGSRLGGHKVCHTRREWEQISADARDSTAQHQSGSFACQPPMAC